MPVSSGRATSNIHSGVHSLNLWGHDFNEKVIYGDMISMKRWAWEISSGIWHPYIEVSYIVGKILSSALQWKCKPGMAYRLNLADNWLPIFNKSRLPIFNRFWVLPIPLTNILKIADISVFYRYIGGKITKI